jgi:hypothetical protein
MRIWDGRTVFFFARSPDAPRTTIVTSFFNSIALFNYQPLGEPEIRGTYAPWGWRSAASLLEGMIQRTRMMKMQWIEVR